MYFCGYEGSTYTPENTVLYWGLRETFDRKATNDGLLGYTDTLKSLKWLPVSDKLFLYDSIMVQSA